MIMTETSNEMNAFLNDTAITETIVSNSEIQSQNIDLLDTGGEIDTSNLYPTPVSTFENNHPLLQDEQPNETQSNEEYNDILTYLQYETGLLTLPEDYVLTPDNVQEAIQISDRYKTESLIEQIKNKAGDEYVAELFDIVWEGGTIEDVQFVKNVIEDDFYLDNLDLDSEEDQRKIITNYLQESLDPNGPTYKRQLANISNQVNDIIDTYSGKAVAEEAFAYYKELFEYEKNQRFREIQEREQARIEQERLIAKQQEDWRKAFKEDLAKSKWSDKKKEDVFNQFNQVKLTDGSELPLWEYKMERIWENPELTKHLMDFLSQFDEYNLKFKTADSVKQAVTNKLTELVKNTKQKNDSSVSNGGYNNKSTNNEGSSFNNFLQS